MIVLDASTVVELLLNTDRGHSIAERIRDPAVGLHAPHLLDVEVAQVLRRLHRIGDIDLRTAGEALEFLQQMDIERHPHDSLLNRAWALRKNMTMYDAVYVALAEALRAPLLTCDSRLARAPGAGCRVELIH
jgi:predicted nucleic acid-binding protein